MTVTRADIGTLASMDDLRSLSLNTASISDTACALLGFQRTKQISRRSRLIWENGDTSALAQEVQDRKSEIVQGAMLEIYQEYIPLKKALSGQDIKTVCDIGCGQAINDVFLQADFQPAFTLVDIEETEDQYHNWADSGSGYASLESAKNLLLENGVAAASIEMINPRKDQRDVNLETFDLVTSFYSCGFHYPVDEYIELFVNTVKAGGAVCLDIRGRYLTKGSEALSQLSAVAEMEVV